MIVFCGIITFTEDNYLLEIINKIQKVIHLVIGILKIKLSIDEVYSLKEKRHVIKSIIERLRARFNASVAEVDLNDKWNGAIIGVACISNEASHADSQMANIVNFVENDGRAFVIDYTTELEHYE